MTGATRRGNILVIKHGAFGDFIQALGAMRAIRQVHKDAKITLLTTKPFVALAEASGYFDAVAADLRPKWYQFIKLSVLRRFLNDGKFGRVYDLQNSERTGLYLGLFKRVPEWSGIAFSASHHMPDDAARRTLHVFDALRAQLAIAGIKKVEVDDLSWIKANVDSFALPKPYVLIAAGCSPQHPKKRWPVDRYVALAQWIAAQGHTPVLLGTAAEADVNAQILASCPQAVDLTGLTTIQQVAVLARQAAAAVGNDTGPIQMIGPTGCRTIGLYPGFSNPKRHGPLGVNVVTIQKPAMADISIDEVAEKLAPWVAGIAGAAQPAAGAAE
ncbi:MAG: glycosyltransferase family 9 protein [Rhodospirillales bacterium]|nr:glycosyltransferase family 9 protein [Alphaproteobacteria bacterium]MCB9986726.1 glycosyltransferase family 9 protein [Rhodospirillales bacterium]USO08504.1 MAG: glycosyltransferase family 9 protein [Rhodospirillales bacterium]